MIELRKYNYVKEVAFSLIAVATLLFPSTVTRAEDLVSISGEWEVLYEDRALGPVKGLAKVSEDESSVEVSLMHPETGKSYNLNSTEIRRDKNNIEIILEGRSPESAYIDGYGYPDQAITISKGSSNIAVSVGDSKAEVAIKPRIPVDLDRVTIKFVIEGYNKLQGNWSYKAEPITERDQDGYGRVGQFEFNKDRTGLQKGWEVWSRPEQLIVGTFPIEYQTSVNQKLRTTGYPHPFKGNKNNKNESALRRTIFIFGENLPKDSKSAKFESGSEFVEYGNVKLPDNKFLLPGDLNPFVRGKKKLLEYSDPSEHDGLTKLDFLVVEVKLKKGVMPGLQSFKLNDQEATWMLQFGDNRASVNFARKINPDLPRNRIYIWKNSKTGEEVHQVGYKEELSDFNNPWKLIRKAHPEKEKQWVFHWKNIKTGEKRSLEGPRKDFLKPANPGNPWKFIREVKKEYEDTQDLFIPEYTRIEVRTELDLNVDTINVTIGKNNEVLKFGKSPLLPARRTADDPRVFRTDPIALVKTTGSPLPKSKSKLSINVKEKDSLKASIAETGLISLTPPPARADIHTTPARVPGQTSYLWKDQLMQAATCHDIEIKDWDRDNAEFVDKISKRLILEGKWEDLELFSVPGIIKEILFGTKLETHFQLGDHAAMLLARQVFLKMINEKIYSFANDYQTDKQLGAFWLHVDPHRWNSIEHPIASYELDINVSGNDGKKIAFFDSYYLKNESRNPENISPWIISATRDALEQYTQILVKSRAMVEEMDVCDVEDLLMLTGNTFDAVEVKLVSRLVRLEEKRGTLSWKPDDQARLRVNHIANTFDTAKRYQKLSEADTQNLLAAAAIITLPIHMGTGPIVAGVISISEVAFETALAGYKYYKSQQEIEFARGTADVLGYGRYRRAKAEEFDYVDLALQVAMAIGQEWGGGKLFEVATESAVASIKKTYKFFQNGLRRLRVRRGKEILKGLKFDLDSVPANFKQADRRNIAEYITDAALVRNANRMLDDDQLKVLKYLDSRSEKHVPAKQPDWAKNIDEATYKDLENLSRRGVMRGDLKELMESGSEIVSSALRGKDRDIALQILLSSPQRTPVQFKRALNQKKKMITGDKTARYMDQASELDAKSNQALKDGHWSFKTEGPDSDGVYKIRELDPNGSPNNKNRAFVSGEFKDGNFTMKEAFIYDTKSMIDAGLDVPLIEGKGVPTIQFMYLRLMKKLGIGFGGSGEALNKVTLANILNTQSAFHIHWVHKTHFPNKKLADLADNKNFEALLMETPAVVYAKDLLEKSGYEVTGARLVIDPNKVSHPPATGISSNYKPMRGKETAAEFNKRYGFADGEKILINYDIELKAQPKDTAEKPKQLLVVEEWDPGDGDGLDDALKPKQKDIGKVDPVASEDAATKNFIDEYSKNRETERVAREKANQELMKRRVEAPRFKAKENVNLRNKKVGHMVSGDAPRLKTLMRGYKAVQPHVYEGNINKYAQDMIDQKLEWEKIIPEDRIVLSPDGKTIVHGHHRFIAAHLASQATGRPITGGKNPIIPKEGFGPAKEPVSSMGNFDIEVRKGFKE